MATNSPPDGVTISVGTWGTDADRNESTVLSGGSSLHLKNTAVATKVLSPIAPIEYTSDGTGSANRMVPVWATIKVDSTTAGRTITVEAIEYDEDLTSLATTTIHNAVAADTNWNVYSSNINLNASTRYMQITVAKAAQTFNVYIDSWVIEPTAPFFRAEVGGDINTIPSSATWQTFSCAAVSSSSDLEYLGVAPPSPGPGTGLLTVTVLKPGPYFISSQVGMESLADGDSFDIRININSGTITEGHGPIVGAAGTGWGSVMHIVPLVTGDTIEINVRQQTGTSKVLYEDSHISIFRLAY